MNNARQFAIAVALAICAAGLASCVVSKFSLAPESRLPVWFTLPNGMTRDEIDVTLSYVTTAVTSENAVLEMRDKNGIVISRVAGIQCLHPSMEPKKNSKGGLGADAFPEYRIIRAQGKTEIVEHRMEPIFRVIDDAYLASSPLPEACRHD